MSEVLTREPEAAASARGANTTGRLAGFGGLVFGTTLVIQNIVRSSAPGFDASPDAVTHYFLNNRAAALLPLGLFPIGMVALFAFVSGLYTKAVNPRSKWWATLGLLAVALIAAMFATLNAIEIVITAKSSQLAETPTVIQALWTLHGAAFGFDLAGIAAALVGLSQAGYSSQLLPKWVAVLAWPGALCLITSSVFTTALVNGGPWLFVGLVGFVVWLVFLVVASVSMLRD